MKVQGQQKSIAAVRVADVQVYVQGGYAFASANVGL
jgi:hypothetical protein